MFLSILLRIFILVYSVDDLLIPMADVTIISEILMRRAENVVDGKIVQDLLQKGRSQDEVNKALDALEEDTIFTVKTLDMLTPISPIVYHLGVRRIEKVINHYHGLFKTTIEIAVKTIDKVNVYKNLISADVTIVHSDDNEIHMSGISRHDAEEIRELYCAVIESQRKKIINIAQDF